MTDPISPAIEALVAAARDDPAAMEAFWRAAQERGGPIIEPDPDDDRSRLVTFLWRDPDGARRNVVVVGGAAPWEDLDALVMRRIEGTDAWARTFRCPADIRSRYWLSPDDSLEPPGADPGSPDRYATLRPDPLAPVVYHRPTRPGDEGDPDEASSILELPDAPPLAIPIAADPVRDPRLVPGTVDSRILGRTRTVWTYRPRDVAPAWGLVLTDGWEWSHVIALGAVLDRRIADGTIPPLAAVLVDTGPPGRNDDMERSPAFVSFLADELAPWLAAEAGDPSLRDRLLIAGQSLGGLNALFAGLERPDVFPRVLAQSGSFWHGAAGRLDAGTSLMARVADDAGRRLAIYQDVGWLEGTEMLDVNRTMRDALLAAGHRLTYREFSGGHDWLAWQVGLVDGIHDLTSR